MYVQNIQNIRRPRRIRKGALHPALLMFAVVLVVLTAIALNISWLWSVRVDLQRTADAAALAAARELVDDDLLRGQLGNTAESMPSLLARSSQFAIFYANVNPVGNQPLPLEANPTNDIDGDIVFVTLDTPFSKIAIPATDLSDSTNLDLLLINTVRINATRSKAGGDAVPLFFSQLLGLSSADARARSSAMIDRDVIGFRHTVEQPIPLAPLALLADYTAEDLLSWHFQVEAQNGEDLYRYNRNQKKFLSGADGLFEFVANIQIKSSQVPSDPISNICQLQFGSQDFSSQLLNGITKLDLQEFGGQFVLDANNMLCLPGTIPEPEATGEEIDTLVAALGTLRDTAAIRIWPLYCSVDVQNGQVCICGFVAARVVTVEVISGGTRGESDRIEFRLQPTMIAINSVVTDATQRGINGIPIVNPYICKVRLVE